MTSPAPIETLMQETPGGDNHGRTAPNGLIGSDTVGKRWLSLGVEEHQAEEFMRGEGFGIVETSRGSGGRGKTYGARDAGMTAHRGVLHPDEYVDPDLLHDLVAAELGFTVEEIESAYKNGRPTPQRASIRAHIDARLLALSRSGGNMLELSRALGWGIFEGDSSGGTNCRKMERALARALAAEGAAA